MNPTSVAFLFAAAELPAIAGWLVSGAAGVALLAGGCWWASTRAWRKDDAAPGVTLPTSLHELRARHRR